MRIVGAKQFRIDWIRWKWMWISDRMATSDVAVEGQSVSAPYIIAGTHRLGAALLVGPSWEPGCGNEPRTTSLINHRQTSLESGFSIDQARLGAGPSPSLESYYFPEHRRWPEAHRPAW